VVIVPVVWSPAGAPPVRYLLRYGPFPGCDPTGQTRTVEGIEFIEIGPGAFRMGSPRAAWRYEGDWLGRICAPLGLPWGDQPRTSVPSPVRWVEIPRKFWIARNEITNAQIERWNPDFRRSTDSAGDDDPAARLTPDDIAKYCRWLSARAGFPVRLPTEREWECACRAGSRSEYCFGDGPQGINAHVWYGGNSGLRAHPVATNTPNAWGLHDMHGNVAEPCGGFDDSGHTITSVPVSLEGGIQVMIPAVPQIRGGDWASAANSCRAAHAGPRFVLDFELYHDFHEYRVGLRPAFSPPTE